MPGSGRYNTGFEYLGPRRWPFSFPLQPPPPLRAPPLSSFFFFFFFFPSKGKNRLLRRIRIEACSVLVSRTLWFPPFVRTRKRKRGEEEGGGKGEGLFSAAPHHAKRVRKYPCCEIAKIVLCIILSSSSCRCRVVENAVENRDDVSPSLSCDVLVGCCARNVLYLVSRDGYYYFAMCINMRKYARNLSRSE